MIEREHLTIVRTLASRGTLTEAAETLHLTQSALSHAVRRLEERAGTRVWRKVGRRLELTEAGAYLLRVAELIVPRLEEADATLAGYAEGKRGTLRIGMECHPCYEWLVGALPSYLETNPRIDVDVVQRFQFSGHDALVNHEIDLLITPDPLRRPGLAFEPVLEYEMRLVTRSPIPGATDYVRPQDFLRLDLLTYPVARDRLDVFTRLLIPAGVEPRSVRAVEATELMIELVRAGRGVTALPDWIVERLRKRDAGSALHDYSLGRECVTKQLAVGYRDEDTALPYLQSFLNHVRVADVAGSPPSW